MPSRWEICIAWLTPSSKRIWLVGLSPVMCVSLVLGMIGLGRAKRASAQETPKPQAQASPSQAGPAPASHATVAVPPAPVALYNLLQEKSIVFPDIAYSTERLSTAGKFELFVDNSISVNAVTWSLLGSAVGQADHSPTGFAEGWGGYSERFGTDMAREASTNFFGTFLLASVLHQDPRFYAEREPRFFASVKYSFKRLFIARDDDGREVPNYSGLAGPLLAEGLANLYWPERNRTVGDTLVRYGIDLASRTSGNMFREYWPVLLKKISHVPAPAAQ